MQHQLNDETVVHKNGGGQPNGEQSAQRQLCKFHINGRCAKGASCPFLHVDVHAAPRVRQAWIADRRQHRHRMAAEAGDPHAGGAQRKRQRAAIFAQWLLDTFGHDALNKGTGVLDIAGGSGSLSFCLQTVHGVRCTTIDPRPAKLSKDAHRHLARIRAEAAGAAAGSFMSLLDSNAACESLWGCLEQDASSAANDLSSVRLSEGRPAHSQDSLQGTLPDHIEAEFNKELWNGEHAPRLQAASLVVGLHPDQATDSIVKFAVEHKKAFAVVPCCVFPRLFKHRRLKGSVPVIVHAELVEYLRQLGGQSSQVDHLEFEGMNQVVFRK
ncbi:hypothetical protein WJX75_002561 [Coccomyxa subellipsoidea]|uniref:C3H1-type domain-containing protein n=1 Tax=Coccomyxa subellipsoidea TaxID=248742 RepID=A0ABR2YM87_9CHLO